MDILGLVYTSIFCPLDLAFEFNRRWPGNSVVRAKKVVVGGVSCAKQTKSAPESALVPDLSLMAVADAYEVTLSFPAPPAPRVSCRTKADP